MIASSNKFIKTFIISHFIALLSSLLRCVISYSVFAAIFGRVLIGLPFAIFLLFPIISTSLVLLFPSSPTKGSSQYSKTLMLRYFFSILFSILDFLTAILTLVLSSFIANFIDSPITPSPNDLPTYYELIFIAAFSFLSGLPSLLASILASIHLISIKKQSKQSQTETASLIPSSGDPSKQQTKASSSSITSKIRTTKDLIFGIAAISCIICSLIALSFSIASITSLGYAFISSGCTINDNNCFSDCEELQAGGCLLPYPSSQFLIIDNTTETGYRLKFTKESMPHFRSSGKHIDPKLWNELDGFSVVAPALFDIPGATALVFELTNNTIQQTTTLPNLINYANTTTSKTAIIDADNLELVPHWAELDAIGNDRPLVILQPAEPLKYNHKYIAAVRGLYDLSTGKLAPNAPGFDKIMKEKTGDRWIEFKDEILPVIKKVLYDWKEEELQLAWNWKTASRKRTLGRLELMRDDVLSDKNNDEISYKVLKVQNYDCSTQNSSVGRTIIAEITIPSYLEGINKRASLLKDRPGSETVSATGKLSANFIVEIPCSVIQNDKPSFLLQYGHGFYGGCQEIQKAFLREMANRFQWIIFGMDWRGMSRYDLLTTMKTLISDPSEIAILGEEVSQAHINLIALLQLMRTKFLTDPNILTKDGKTSLIDPSRFAYYGISQGGILGAAYTALSTQIERVGLSVPGGSLSMIFSRSSVWSLFGPILRLTFYSQRDTRLYISLMQSMLDQMEAGGWARSMTLEPGKGCKPKRVLIQDAIDDALVANLATHFIARAYNSSTIYPQTRSIPFINEIQLNSANASYIRNAIVEWKYLDVPDAPVNNIPPSKSTDPHECPRREFSAQEQLRVFLESGIILQTNNNSTAVRPKVCHVKHGFI